MAPKKIAKQTSTGVVSRAAADLASKKTSKEVKKLAGSIVSTQGQKKPPKNA